MQEYIFINKNKGEKMIKCISFDLQGTISDSEFSNNFWLEQLPNIYAIRNNMSLQQAKQMLQQEFKRIGKYDMKYYDDKYWNDLLEFDTKEILNKMKKRPKLNKEFMNFIKLLSLPKIIISTTTKVFIDYELGENKNNFVKRYSCVDHFKMGGKKKEVYQEIANQLHINTKEILHIGDDYQMDIKNAKEAEVNVIYYNSVKEAIKQINTFLGK